MTTSLLAKKSTKNFLFVALKCFGIVNVKSDLKVNTYLISMVEALFLTRSITNFDNSDELKIKLSYEF